MENTASRGLTTSSQRPRAAARRRELAPSRARREAALAPSRGGGCGAERALRRTTLADRAVGAYLQLSLPALAFPQRPGGWAALHLALALPVLHAPARNRLLDALLRRRPEWWQVLRVWYPLLLGPWLYQEVALLNRVVHGGRYFDGAVQALEATLFGGQPSQTWLPAAPWLWLSELLHAAYLSYYFLVFVPPLILHRQGQRRAAAVVVGVLMLVSVLHYLVFIYFPVQGPRYLFPPPGAGLRGPPTAPRTGCWRPPPAGARRSPPAMWGWPSRRRWPARASCRGWRPGSAR